MEWNCHKQVSLFELHVAPPRAQFNESYPLQRGDDFLWLSNRWLRHAQQLAHLP